MPIDNYPSDFANFANNSNDIFSNDIRIIGS